MEVYANVYTNDQMSCLDGVCRSRVSMISRGWDVHVVMLSVVSGGRHVV